MLCLVNKEFINPASNLLFCEMYYIDYVANSCFSKNYHGQTSASFKKLFQFIVQITTKRLLLKVLQNIFVKKPVSGYGPSKWVIPII